MNWNDFAGKIKEHSPGAEFRDNGPDEAYIEVKAEAFRPLCLFLHDRLRQPVAFFFATDERSHNRGFGIRCGFRAPSFRKWIVCVAYIDARQPVFESLSRFIHSASFFEREMKEMFGIEAQGAPDDRRLRLHDEVWPSGAYPLRKDFRPSPPEAVVSEYPFSRGKGEGMFEVPVGPVHAGIIGPGHFRFSVAGEPIVNLEIRLGFTHRGAEKLFEGKGREGVGLAECVSGDSSFAHGLAFCRSFEKISGISVPDRAVFLRSILLELERMYNHVSGMGGLAVDVAFSYPAALAAVIKETLQRLNRELTGSRFLKKIIAVGGLDRDIPEQSLAALTAGLEDIEKKFFSLKAILDRSVSFMDRVESTGVLRKKTAQDLGITGPAARASGLGQDLRFDMENLLDGLELKPALEMSGDVLARLKIRFAEFESSLKIIRHMAKQLPSGSIRTEGPSKPGFALGSAEGWRGPVLYWVQISPHGLIERCKITDASFLNWQGLAYCVLGEIIPDFPVCNKSFDLSYSGSDL